MKFDTVEMTGAMTALCQDGGGKGARGGRKRLHVSTPVRPPARLLRGERVMEVAAISDSTGNTSFKRRSPRRPALSRIMTGAMTVTDLNNVAALTSERQLDLDPTAFILCRLRIK